MKRFLPIAYLVAGLAIGIFLGKGFGSSPQAVRDDPEPPKSRTVRQERPAPAAPNKPSIEKIRKAPPTQLAKLTLQAMHTPDPIEMRRHLTECLLNMTPENWQEVVAGFDKLSKETGRDTPEEWRLALFRAGQIAGADAMDVYLAAGLDKRNQESWHGLYGWSTKNPQAALDWLKNAETAGHKVTGDHYTAVIAGTALQDLQEAFNLLANIPPEMRQKTSGHLVWNALQNSGTDGLETVLKYASALDTSNPNDAEFATSLLQEVSEKLLWKADHARDVSQGCEAVLKLAQYGQDPTAATHQALQKYRYYSMADKLSMVETISNAQLPAELNLSRMASTLFSTMNHGHDDLAAVREWMGNNPDSPLVPYLQKRMGSGAAQ
jgi:hypothetical protein